MDKNNVLKSSSSNDTSSGKRKKTPTIFHHNSEEFYHNNVKSSKKVDKSRTVGNNSSIDVIDLTSDAEDEPIIDEQQESINVDFIRDYWWPATLLADENREEAVDVSLLVSTYIYAAKSRSLCSSATIKRLKLVDEITNAPLLIDESCVPRLRDDITFIDAAIARLQNQLKEEDDVFKLAKEQWKETEVKYKISRASTLALKSYIVKNKSDLSALKGDIIKQRKELYSPSAKSKIVSSMKHYKRNSDVLASSSGSVIDHPEEKPIF
jgi:hypothetical protein